MIEVNYYNLSVSLSTNNHNLVNHIEVFLKKFYTLKTQAFNNNQETQPTDKQFVGKLKTEPTYLFHTNQFLHLAHYLKENNFNLTDVTKEDKREYTIAEENYRVKDGWVLKEDQLPLMEFLTKPPLQKSRLLGLRTGGGKTVVSLFALAKIGWRTGIVILPTYIDKWQGDVLNVHDSTMKDIMVIKGSASVRGLISLAKEGSYVGRYIIFSSRTLQEFITKYEENPYECVENYGCTPLELMPLLGIGVILVDESHQHYHAIYRILIYSNVKYQIGLSATLLSDDSVVSRAHRVVYTDQNVLQPASYVKYTDVYALSYYVPESLLRKVKFTNYGSKSYSHTAFEQSVSRDRDLKAFHLRLWTNALEDFFIDKYEKGDTCLFFVATVKMADFMTKYLQDRYPEMNVLRYCEDDPFSNFEEGDIVVTTIISAGTAVDKANLRTVIQTVSVSSTVANIQNLGRLRQLKDGKDTRFVYIYANNIRKQASYHYKRQDLFRDRVATLSIRRARV